MPLRYLEASKVDLPATAPQFTRPGHCLWCNLALNGRATKFCRAGKDRYIDWEGYPISHCLVQFHNWWYSRPAYQRAVLIRDNFTCQQCGVKPVRADKPWLPDLSRLHCDHILPVVQGGETALDNLQTLCQSCNLKKGPKRAGEVNGIPSYKLRRDGYPPGRCPKCHYEHYLLLDYKPPEGFDPKLRSVRCRKCNLVYYLAPVIIVRRFAHEIIKRNH